MEPATAIGPGRGAAASEGNLATSMLKILRPGRPRTRQPVSIKIGRATDNDIVIPDVLASRHHATLVPTPAGTEIRDNRSINGTFVNGARVDSAMLRDGDAVTIGNVDLVFAGGTLARRTETEAATRTGGLEVHGVTWTIEGNKTLLDNISLAARPGTLTAVIGPSGAGKSTFARLVAGYTHPTTGQVSFEGHDVHAEYASLRSRIGMVPQDDVVHGELTVRQALMYAAELRLPPDTTKADREQVVNEVLEELEMTKHLDTRVDKLSGGQRKRASVALELLTGPSLLILDEPTSGLDPALDRQVMTMLRQLADAGRVVLVVTHSLTYLDVCDQVLLLAPGGKTAFYGPPNQIGPNWAPPTGPTSSARSPAIQTPPSGITSNATVRHRHRRHAGTRGSRLADAHQRAKTVLHDCPPPDAAHRLRPRLLHLPGVPAVHHGRTVVVGAWERRLRRPVTAIQGGEAPNEPGQILVLLNVGAIFMGTALTIRGADRRTGDLPARAGGRIVHDRIHVRQGLRLRRVRAAAVRCRRRHQYRREGLGCRRGHQRRGDTQPIPRVVRRRRGVLCRRSHGRAWRFRRWRSRTSRSCLCW